MENKIYDSGYLKIPVLPAFKELTAIESLLLSILIYRQNIEQEVKISFGDFAKNLPCKVAARTVIRAINKLETAGYITVTKLKMNVNAYKVDYDKMSQGTDKMSQIQCQNVIGDNDDTLCQNVTDTVTKCHTDYDKMSQQNYDKMSQTLCQNVTTYNKYNKYNNKSIKNFNNLGAAKKQKNKIEILFEKSPNFVFSSPDKKEELIAQRDQEDYILDTVRPYFQQAGISEQQMVTHIFGDGEKMKPWCWYGELTEEKIIKCVNTAKKYLG